MDDTDIVVDHHVVSFLLDSFCCLQAVADTSPGRRGFELPNNFEILLQFLQVTPTSHKCDVK